MRVGGKPFYIAGYTARGAPYGAEVPSILRPDRFDRDRHGWALAKEAIARAAETFGIPDPVPGRAKWIGRGLHRCAYAAWVESGSTSESSEGRELEGDYVALLPLPDTSIALADVQREARLLRFLHARHRGFRVPAPSLAVTIDDEAVLVTAFLDGIPVDLRAGRGVPDKPWEFVGGIAAEIHSTPTEELGWLPGFDTRLEHGLALLEGFDSLPGRDRPEVDAAIEWMHRHLPAEAPSVLLHGDLLGQNLRLGLTGPPGVLDWQEAKRGDPAYDLAILTRGVRRPFQIERGMDRLLASYRDASGVALEASDVRFHELAVLILQHARALVGSDMPQRPKDVRATLLRVLEMAGAKRRPEV